MIADAVGALLVAMADAPWWAWPASLVVSLVAAIASVWCVVATARGALAARRARLEARATGDQKRLRAIRGVRQQLTMDRLITVQFVVAMSFSAWGMAEVARIHAGIPVPVNWALFAVFEGFALVVMSMINQRAEKGLPAGSLGGLYWAVMGLASLFNATHSDHLVGRAVWSSTTLLAAGSYALRMSAKRKGREEELKEAEGRASSRRLALVRWLHPIERVKVALEMARDEQLGADEATRIVRDRAAERRERAALAAVRSGVWALRRAQAAPKPERRRSGRRLRRAEETAQAAIAAAEMATSTERVAAVLRELQMMALAPTWASMDYSSPDEARRTMQRLITPESLAPLALPAAPAQQAAPAPAEEPPAPATVTRLQPVDDAALLERARAVYEPGMSLDAFRKALRVGMRKAHPLHQMLAAEAEETG